MKTYRQLIITITIALLVLACNLPGAVVLTSTPMPETPAQPTSAPAATQTAQAENTAVPPATPTSIPCVYGTWKASDLSAVILAAIPQETIDQYGLRYRSTSGKLLLTLNPDGSAYFDANDLKMEFDAKIAFFTVPLVISLDGESSGRYSDDGSTITTSGFETAGITASARAAGQDVLSQADILSGIPMLQPPFNVAAYTCSGDTLQASVAGYPATIPALTFEREE